MTEMVCESCASCGFDIWMTKAATLTRKDDGMKRPSCTPDHTAPRRVITDGEARLSGFPRGTEVTASITTDQLMESAPFRLYKPRG